MNLTESDAVAQNFDFAEFAGRVLTIRFLDLPWSMFEVLSFKLLPVRAL